MDGYINISSNLISSVFGMEGVVTENGRIKLRNED